MPGSRGVCARGCYGQVTADSFDGRRLPYIDNLVNVLIADDLGEVAMAEAMRVACARRSGPNWGKDGRQAVADRNG